MRRKERKPKARRAHLLGILGLEFGVWGLGIGVWGLGFRVWGLGLRLGVSGVGFRCLFGTADSFVLVEGSALR